MAPWRYILLHLYYYGSYPYRCLLRKRWRDGTGAPVVVLIYHRIADDGATAWTMSNRNFSRQIRWLESHFELISMGEAQRRIRQRGNERPCVTITFDDGYSENCLHAIPLLLNKQIPCTYFVTAKNVLDDEPFMHDEALGYRFPPNDVRQLRAMAAEGIEIGSHGYSHRDLGIMKNKKDLHEEVITSAERLRDALKRPVRFFAIPFGRHVNINVETFTLAEAFGYEAVCSAYGGYNFPGDDPFHLQRIPLDNDMIGMKNRATVDPRKLKVNRFPYVSKRFGVHREVSWTMHP